MQQIMSSFAKTHNTHSSVFSQLPSVGIPTTTNFQKTYLPKPLFKKLKAIHHDLAKPIIEQHQYKPTTEKLLRALINNSDKNGVSRVSQRFLAFELRVSTKTIERHMAKLVADKVIDYRKNGYLVSNTTILLFIKPELPYETDKMSTNLNPPEAPLKEAPSGGVLGKENKSAESLANALPAQEEQIWDDFIPLSSQELEKGKSLMAKLRETCGL